MIAVATSAVIPLSPLDLALAAALVLLAGLISIVLGLRLESRLLIASLRTVVQLLLVGLVLRWVFAREQLPVILLLAMVMIAAAAQAAVARAKHRLRGAYWRALLTLTASGLLTTVFVTAIVVGAEPWYRAQYFIPLLGMVLGNGLNGISLCLDTLLDTLRTKQPQVEMELALGATRWEAARDHLADAVRRGMIPIINTMMVVGIVSLPGMMTGQILAGANPLEAVKYQIVVMFMIAGATSLGCIGMALLIYRRVFTPDHRLRIEAIEPRP